jgi:hypothetical protein
MIASVVVIFFLLLVTHHRQTPDSTRSSSKNGSSQSQGIAGDHGVTTATHLPIHDTVGMIPVDTTRPKIALLLTYPSSGASFLIHLFQTLTDTNTASMIGSYYTSYQVDTSPPTTTNTKTVLPTSYQEIYIPPISIYSTNHTLGPFWVMDPYPSSTHPSSHSNTQSILTETHCSGTCAESPCLPSDYIQSIYSFEQACRTLFIKTPPPPVGKNIRTTRRRYLQGGGASTQSSSGSSILGVDMQRIGTVDPSLVTRAIHLIRDPWSNIVSRFHASRRVHFISSSPELNTSPSTATSIQGGNSNTNTTTTNTTVNGSLSIVDPWLANHPDTMEGLHNWCQDMMNTDGPFLDNNSYNDTLWSLYFPSSWDTISSLMQSVSCSYEIFKYVMWHNHAEEMSAMYFDSPSHVVYFEDLQDSQDRIQIIHDMTTFLNMTTSSKSSTTKGGGIREGDFFMDRVWYGDKYFSEDERKNMELLIQKLAFPKTLGLLKRYFEPIIEKS